MSGKRINRVVDRPPDLRAVVITGVQLCAIGEHKGVRVFMEEPMRRNKTRRCDVFFSVTQLPAVIKQLEAIRDVEE